MITPQPCLGYPTRTAAVMALAEAGLPRAEIATRLGVSTNSIASLLYQARRRHTAGDRKPRSTPEIVLPLTEAQRFVLREHAASRDVSLERLMLDLLDVIVEDKLVDAILDDGRGTR